jgi:hypothetical protein
MEKVDCVGLYQCDQVSCGELIIVGREEFCRHLVKMHRLFWPTRSYYTRTASASEIERYGGLPVGEPAVSSGVEAPMGGSTEWKPKGVQAGKLKGGRLRRDPDGQSGGSLGSPLTRTVSLESGISFGSGGCEVEVPDREEATVAVEDDVPKAARMRISWGRANNFLGGGEELGEKLKRAREKEKATKKTVAKGKTPIEKMRGKRVLPTPEGDTPRRAILLDQPVVTTGKKSKVVKKKGCLTCQQCGLELAGNDELRIHLTLHVEDKFSQCAGCKVNFWSRTKFREHLVGIVCGAVVELVKPKEKKGG